jgi:Ca-activated chloride channel family protein
MAPALRAALEDHGKEGTVRQVIFITDGCVGNEQALFGLIAERLGRSRLFTVGIGSAPNSFFMERAARFGRGTFTHIGSPTEVQARMGELFAKLEKPVLSDIEVAWPDATAESWPRRIPDLYAGEPVVVATRLGTIAGEAVVRGLRGHESWEVRCRLDGGSARAGVDKLWARRKIADLMDGLATGADPDDVRTGVVEVALRHHLVSRYTSLVAVDVTPTRPRDQAVSKRAVKTNLPAGWNHAAVFGALPQGGTNARLLCLLGLILILGGLALGRLATRG